MFKKSSRRAGIAVDKKCISVGDQQARQDDIKTIRAELIKGEQSGLSDRTPDDIIKAVIERKRIQGEL